MNESYNHFRDQLQERRAQLIAAKTAARNPAEIARLLLEVDSALERMEDGSYGVCIVCHEPIERDLLMTDPTIRVCLGDLSAAQRRALEQDLDLASRIQTKLLPRNGHAAHGWDISFTYSPAGPVGGDYWDLIPANGNKDGPLLFVMGDVSGKGLAASMLVTHLHALFHSLIPYGYAVDELVGRVNRLLCESSILSFYATAVCGRLNPDGTIELCNAGHNPPLLLRNRESKLLYATGVPIGMFCESTYEVTRVKLDPDETLLLYTDGYCEAERNGVEYGLDRVLALATRERGQWPEKLLQACVADLNNYLGGAERQDDLTLAAIRRVA